MWHIACDKWHVTCDMWWTLSQNVSSLALTVCDFWYYEDLEEKDDSVTKWMNYEAVYRTAPATRGLLIIEEENVEKIVGISRWRVCYQQGYPV